MKIIIPMSGQGKRFKEKGYHDPKSLILVTGKPIIEHVVEMFPKDSDFIFICNKNHLESTSMRNVLDRIAPHGKVLEIDEHSHGPVYATSFAFSFIDDTEEVIVSYCDYKMVFDYNDMLEKVKQGGYSGAVPAYTGFHPHLLHKGVYGGVLRDDDGVMLDYKEKHSFTENLMDSYHSAGMYYFKTGKELKEYTQELLDSDINLNGEKYTSMLYYFYLRDGKKIYVPEVSVFMQWGTPEDLEEYVFFENEIYKKLGKLPEINGIPEKRAYTSFYESDKETSDKVEAYWRTFIETNS
jgi:NDP-sugar pyrophosphorylase family protein